MHDIKWIRDNAAEFDGALKRRGLAPLSAELVAIDDKRRAILTALQEAQARRNAASKDIGKAKATKDEATAARLMDEVAALKDTIAKGEEDERAVNAKLEAALAIIPNLPREDVPRTGFRRALRVSQRRARPPRTRHCRLHARQPHIARWRKSWRLHRSQSAASREGRRRLRHGQLAQVRRGPLPDDERVLADPHRRSLADEPRARSDPRRGQAARPRNRLDAVFPFGSRSRRTRYARHDPPAPILESRTRVGHDAGNEPRRARAHDGLCRRHPEGAGSAVPYGSIVHGGHGLRLPENLRYRGLAARSGHLSRDFILFRLRRLPIARFHPVPSAATSRLAAWPRATVRRAPRRSATSTR